MRQHIAYRQQIISSLLTLCLIYHVRWQHISSRITQQHFFQRSEEGLSGWLSLLFVGESVICGDWTCLGRVFIINDSPSARNASSTWLPVLALTSLNSLTPCLSMKARTCWSETASLGTSDLLASSMMSQSASRYLLTYSIQNSLISWKLILSSMAQTRTTALAPRQQADTIDLKASEPAVSQICILIFFPRMSMVLNLKSTPIVESRFQEQMLSTKRCSKELFPTPELPAIIILKPSSQSFSISYYYKWTIATIMMIRDIKMGMAHKQIQLT